MLEKPRLLTQRSKKRLGGMVVVVMELWCVRRWWDWWVGGLPGVEDDPSRPVATQLPAFKCSLECSPKRRGTHLQTPCQAPQ